MRRKKSNAWHKGGGGRHERAKFGRKGKLRFALVRVSCLVCRITASLWGRARGEGNDTVGGWGTGIKTRSAGVTACNEEVTENIKMKLRRARRRGSQFPGKTNGKTTTVERSIVITTKEALVAKWEGAGKRSVTGQYCGRDGMGDYTEEIGRTQGLCK